MQFCDFTDERFNYLQGYTSTVWVSVSDLQTLDPTY